MRKAFVLLTLNSRVHTICEYLFRLICWFQWNGSHIYIISSSSCECVFVFVRCSSDKNRKQTMLAVWKNHAKTKSNFVHLNHADYTWWTFSSWFQVVQSQFTVLLSFSFAHFRSLFLSFSSFWYGCRCCCWHLNVNHFLTLNTHHVQHENMWKNEETFFNWIKNVSSVASPSHRALSFYPSAVCTAKALDSKKVMLMCYRWLKSHAIFLTFFTIFNPTHYLLF